ncbi:MAG: helix-turn-helix transcriptional regulator [bacterium]|nr:helix-turn-helix transcriptional regulator [bacterium]
MLNIDKKYIGQKIKEARKALKMSQFELAEKTNLHEKQIYRIETGENSPSLDNFLKIANVLNLKINYFEGFELPQSKNMLDVLEILKNSSDKEIELYLQLMKTVKNYAMN